MTVQGSSHEAAGATACTTSLGPPHEKLFPLELHHAASSPSQVSPWARHMKQRILRDEIVPLLEEYCYDNFHTLQQILGKDLVDERAGASTSIHPDSWPPKPRVVGSIPASRARSGFSSELVFRADRCRSVDVRVSGLTDNIKRDR